MDKCMICTGEADRMYKEAIETGVIGGCYEDNPSYLCDEHYEELVSDTLIITRDPDGKVIDFYINVD